MGTPVKSLLKSLILSCASLLQISCNFLDKIKHAVRSSPLLVHLWMLWWNRVPVRNLLKSWSPIRSREPCKCSDEIDYLWLLSENYSLVTFLSHSQSSNLLWLLCWNHARIFRACFLCQISVKISFLSQAYSLQLYPSSVTGSFHKKSHMKILKECKLLYLDSSLHNGHLSPISLQQSSQVDKCIHSVYTVSLSFSKHTMYYSIFPLSQPILFSEARVWLF